MVELTDEDRFNAIANFKRMMAGETFDPATGTWVQSGAPVDQQKLMESFMRQFGFSPYEIEAPVQ